MAGRKTYSIPVSKKLLQQLETAKGKKSWEVFLRELNASWTSTQAPVPPPKAAVSAPALPFRDASGTKMDVMKAWSMEITDDGIRVEEIPHTEPGSAEKEPKTKRPAP